MWPAENFHQAVSAKYNHRVFGGNFIKLSQDSKKMQWKKKDLILCTLQNFSKICQISRGITTIVFKSISKLQVNCKSATSTTSKFSIACRLIPLLHSEDTSDGWKMCVYVFKSLTIEEFFKSSASAGLALRILTEGEEQLISFWSCIQIVTRINNWVLRDVPHMTNYDESTQCYMVVVLAIFDNCHDWGCCM